MDKNIQEALKWIYASLGGDISDLAAVDDITVILNAIAALDTVKKISGATELPTVTAADNGEVLTVVNGAWDKAVPGGGVLVVTATSMGPGSTLDKTWDEIYEGVKAGKLVFVRCDEGVDPTIDQELDIYTYLIDDISYYGSYNLSFQAQGSHIYYYSSSTIDGVLTRNV